MGIGLIIMTDERGNVIEAPFVIEGGVCGHGVSVFEACGGCAMETCLHEDFTEYMDGGRVCLGCGLEVG